MKWKYKTTRGDERKKKYKKGGKSLLLSCIFIAPSILFWILF